MLVIALTGGIGAGKTSAGSLLAQLGAIHASADEFSRSILERGEEGFNRVLFEFSDEILTNGEIDRNKLSEIVFSDASKREKLEEITHPLIAARFDEFKRSLPRQCVLVYEIPLLAETPERVSEFDVVLSIETNIDVRIRRLSDRGLALHQIHSRISAQVSDAKRAKIAHHVIENNGNEEELFRALERFWAEFIAPKITL